jgi:hypothetical protein
MDTHLQQLLSEIASFHSSRNRGHLVNANNQADSVLTYTAQLALSGVTSSPEAQQALEVVRERAEQLASALLAQEGRLRDRLHDLEARVEATVQEVSTQKGRLDTAIAEYQQQFSAAEGTRQSQVAEALKTHNQRLDQALADAQARLQSSLADASRRTDAMLQEASSMASSQLAALEDSGRKVIAQLEDLRAKAQDLLHVIGSTGMAGEYQKAANSARKFAVVWQVIAGIAMAGLITFAIMTYVATQEVDVRWGGVAARAFVTLTFGILAAYAARQSDRYSFIEVRNRRYQLELSSIDPYLSSLPEETRHKVKVDLAQRLFGNMAEPLSPTTGEFTGTAKEPLETALSILLELVKKR